MAIEQEKIPLKREAGLTEEEVRQLVDSILQNYQNSIRVLSGMIQANRVRINNLSADPTTGTYSVGDLIVVGGKLKICTTAGSPGTFTIVGTQT